MFVINVIRLTDGYFRARLWLKLSFLSSHEYLMLVFAPSDSAHVRYNVKHLRHYRNSPSELNDPVLTILILSQHVYSYYNWKYTIYILGNISNNEVIPDKLEIRWIRLVHPDV